MVETDIFCNPIDYKTIPLNTYGKYKGKTEAVKAIVERTEKTLKPIVIEDLDFSEKKSVLIETSLNRHAIMLSSLVYSKFRKFFE